MSESTELQQDIAELEAQKREWYQNALSSGILGKINDVCRFKGEKLGHRYGPKYQLILGDLELFLDDYGGYMTVKSKGETLCSTHRCDEIYRPGPWVRTVLDLWEEANEHNERKVCEHLISKREALREQLGLVPESSAVRRWTHEDVLELYNKAKDLVGEISMNEQGARRKEQEAAWESLYKHLTKMERKV